VKAPARRAVSLPKPPLWLVVSTGALAMTCLVLAIAETNLWAHYLIDGGEFLSLFGLGFISLAGAFLFRRHRLFVSLPLTCPWLLYPILTQGDQIIDHLSINAMRIVCHVLLAGIFATPVVVVVLAARHALAPKDGRPLIRPRGLAFIPGLRQLAEGRARQGMGLLATSLLVAEMWVAHEFLGALMVLTIVLMILVVLGWAFSGRAANDVMREERRAGRERLALKTLIAGVLLSGGVYLGFKHRPGAYQGSPSAFMDPTHKDAFYPLDRVLVPTNPPSPPADPPAVEQALTSYARSLECLLSGYHILDRNYTYDFHNHLFLRHTPLLTNYRAVGLKRVEEARQLQIEADAQAVVAKATLAAGDSLAALLEDVQGYAAFSFNRAPSLERMSGEFERTPAGLQHAAHLYEGESKALGTYLQAILRKHQAVLGSPATASTTTDFAAMSHSIYNAYAHHVVGF
jgi:uncharacterized membrane protein